MLNDALIGPTVHKLRRETIGSIGRIVVCNDDFNLIEKGLATQGSEAAFQPARAVVIQDDDAHGGRRLRRPRGDRAGLGHRVGCDACGKRFRLHYERSETAMGEEADSTRTPGSANRSVLGGASLLQYVRSRPSNSLSRSTSGANSRRSDARNCGPIGGRFFDRVL